MGRKNVIAALCLIGFGVFYGYHSAHLPTRTLPNSPDPSFFPWLLTALLLFLASVLLYQGLKHADLTVLQVNTSNQNRSVAGLSLFFVYIAILPWFGFLWTSIPFFAGMLIVYGERRRSWWVIFSVAIPLFLFAVFRYLFQIPLPRAGLFE